VRLCSPPTAQALPRRVGRSLPRAPTRLRRGCNAHTRTFSGEPKDCVRSPARLLLDRGHKASPTGPPVGDRSLVGPHVLERVALCPSRGMSTLPVVVYAFRAPRPGTVTLTASIARLKPPRRRRPATLSRDCDRDQLSVGVTIPSRFVNRHSPAGKARGAVRIDFVWLHR
jgi:hypothetical protein